MGTILGHNATRYCRYPITGGTTTVPFYCDPAVPHGSEHLDVAEDQKQTWGVMAHNGYEDDKLTVVGWFPFTDAWL